MVEKIIHMGDNMKLYTLPQAAEMLEEKYTRVRYVVEDLKIVDPLKIGRTKVFDLEEIKTLQSFFAKPREQQKNKRKPHKKRVK